MSEFTLAIVGIILGLILCHVFIAVAFIISYFKYKKESKRWGDI
jgi:uncharacterized membrane protein YbaN (DUF454 family)